MMEKGNLTLEEWSHLSEEEKRERYRELSDHDKFRVRVTMPPVAKSLRCNGCCYYQGFAKCAAFPDGIPSEQLDKVDEDPETPCANGLKYRKKEVEQVEDRLSIDEGKD